MPADKPVVVRGWVILAPSGEFQMPDLFFDNKDEAKELALRDEVRRATLTIEPKARKRAATK